MTEYKRQLPDLGRFSIGIDSRESGRAVWSWGMELHPRIKGSTILTSKWDRNIWLENKIWMKNVSVGHLFGISHSKSGEEATKAPGNHSPAKAGPGARLIKRRDWEGQRGTGGTHQDRKEKKTVFQSLNTLRTILKCGAFLIVQYCSTCLVTGIPAACVISHNSSFPALEIRQYFNGRNRLCFQTRRAGPSKMNDQKELSFSHPLVQTFEPTNGHLLRGESEWDGAERLLQAAWTRWKAFHWWRFVLILECWLQKPCASARFKSSFWTFQCYATRQSSH